MEVIGYLHAAADYTLTKEPPLPTEEETGWAYIASHYIDHAVTASSNISDSCNKTLHLLPHKSSASPCPAPS